MGVHHPPRIVTLPALILLVWAILAIPWCSSRGPAHTVVGNWMQARVGHQVRGHISPTFVDLMLHHDRDGSLRCVDMHSEAAQRVLDAGDRDPDAKFVHLSLRNRETGFVAVTRRQYAEPRILDPWTSFEHRTALSDTEQRVILEYLEHDTYHGQYHERMTTFALIVGSVGQGGPRLTVWSGWALTAGWLLALLAAPVAGVLFIQAHRAARRVPAGCCPGCGYSLEGLRSDVCPECGTEVSPKRGTLPA